MSVLFNNDKYGQRLNWHICNSFYVAVFLCWFILHSYVMVRYNRTEYNRTEMNDKIEEVYFLQAQEHFT